MGRSKEVLVHDEGTGRVYRTAIPGKPQPTIGNVDIIAQASEIAGEEQKRLFRLELEAAEKRADMCRCNNCIGDLQYVRTYQQETLKLNGEGKEIHEPLTTRAPGKIYRAKDVFKPSDLVASASPRI